MTPDEQRIAMAELDGFKWVNNGWSHRYLTQENGYGPDEESPVCEDALALIPDYLSDLNAVHRVVMKLSESDRHKANDKLCDGTIKSYGEHGEASDISPIINATAPQRCESILRATGKLKD